MKPRVELKQRAKIENCGNFNERRIGVFQRRSFVLACVRFGAGKKIKAYDTFYDGSSSGTKKEKGRGKVYVEDSDFDDDGIDISFFDFSQETFKPTSNSCDDLFLNLLCDENLLRSGIDRLRADHIEPDVKETKHPHINEVNQEQVGVEYRIHDATMEWDQRNPVLGDCYESPEQLKFALTNYVVRNRYQLYFKKSDGLRVIAKYGRYCQDAQPCLFKDIIMKPKLSLSEMKDDILRRFSIHVSMGQCQIARMENMLEGKLEEYYARIWDYAAELLQTNPGSTCKVGVHINPGGVNYFKKFYVYNHVYSISWAVVDVENSDNWGWFLDLLVDDLDLGSGNGLVVTAYQHKAVSEQLPYLEHKQCVRYIYANFRNKFTGLELKNLFWDAAKSTMEGDFIATMEKIRIITKAGYHHLMGRKPQSWWRANFSSGYACDAGDYVPNTMEKLAEYGKYMRDAREFLCFWFHKDMFSATYSDNILPVGGSNMWPKTPFIEPLPPLLRIMPSRSEVNSRKHASESQGTKYPTRRAKSPQPKRKSGRPKKDGSNKPIYHIDDYPVVEGENTSAQGGESVHEAASKDVFIYCEELFDDLFTHKPYVPYIVPKVDASEDVEVEIHEVDHFQPKWGPYCKNWVLTYSSGSGETDSSLFAIHLPYQSISSDFGCKTLRFPVCECENEVSVKVCGCDSKQSRREERSSPEENRFAAASRRRGAFASGFTSSTTCNRVIRVAHCTTFIFSICVADRFYSAPKGNLSKAVYGQPPRGT
ncbi:hypothetical protein LXL04_020963 [Taraxacum kok-saghyz]